MAEEQANVAPDTPAQQNVESEANSNTNTNQAENTEQQNTLTLTPDQEKFISSNGGFEKFFNTAKSAISNPAEKKEEKPEQKEEVKTEPAKTEPAKTEPAPAPAEPAQKPEVRKGAITQQEFVAHQYMKALAGEEKYKGIAKEISDGSVLKDMAQFGIHPLDENGNINDDKVRMYLDLKAQTVHAEPTNTPAATTTPTVDYVKTNEKISSREEAMAVINQSADLRARGQEQHPKTDEAFDFLMKHAR